jgi:ABC-type sugar transport system ATPase subunit
MKVLSGIHEPTKGTITIKDPAHIESDEQLWDKFVLMHHADKI